jgi:hypothetical protein
MHLYIVTHQTTYLRYFLYESLGSYKIAQSDVERCHLGFVMSHCMKLLAGHEREDILLFQSVVPTLFYVLTMLVMNK